MKDVDVAWGEDGDEIEIDNGGLFETTICVAELVYVNPFRLLWNAIENAAGWVCEKNSVSKVIVTFDRDGKLLAIEGIDDEGFTIHEIEVK